MAYPLTYPFPENFPSGYYSNHNLLFPPMDRGVDAPHAGINMLHTDILTWRRKPGMSRWSAVAVDDTNGILGFYSHIYSGNLRVIVDEEDSIAEYTTSSRTQFLTKTTCIGKQASFVGRKDKLYISVAPNPQPSDTGTDDTLAKRTGGGVTTKRWGIDEPTVTPTIPTVNPTTGARVRIGWKYVYAYVDTTDGHVSSRSEESVSTANRLHATFTIRVKGTTQARVDKIRIFRTADGGSTFYFLKDVNNPGTATDVDTTDMAADEDLNVTIVAPTRDDNDPPPVFLDICEHKDRIFGITTDSLRFNLHKSDGKDVNGVQEECWPPLYTFNFNSPIAVKSSSLGCLVFTQSDIYIVTGSTFQDFDPDLLYSGVGISNKNAVAKDGDIFYVFTNTREILRIGDRVEILGTPLSIADLADFDPATVRLTVFRNGTESALYISGDDNKMFRFSTITGTWSTVWQTDGTVITTEAVMGLQTSTGNWDLLIAPRVGSDGFIWKEDSTTHLNDTTPYTCNIRLGSFVLAPLAQLASLRSILTESTVLPIVSFLPQEITGTPTTITTVVAEPPLLVDTSTLVSKRHYPQTTTRILMCRHFQCDLAWTAANDAAELYGFGIEYDQQPLN